MNQDSVKSLLNSKGLSLKEKLGPATAIFIIFITGILFLRPVINSIGTNNANLSKGKENLSKLQSKKNTLKSFQSQDRELVLDEQLKLISQYIPSTKPSLQVLISLINLSRNQSLQYSGMTLNPGSLKLQSLGSDGEIIAERTEESGNVTSGGLSSFSISFSVIGTKQNLEDFVSKLKELAPMMRIEKFSTSFIDKSDQNKIFLDNENLLLSVNLDLKIYYQNVPDKLPAYAEPLPKLTEEEEKLLTDLKQYLFATNEIPTVESLGQGGELGNTEPFKKIQVQADPTARPATRIAPTPTPVDTGSPTD